MTTYIGTTSSAPFTQIIDKMVYNRVRDSEDSRICTMMEDTLTNRNNVKHLYEESLSVHFIHKSLVEGRLEAYPINSFHTPSTTMTR